MANKLWWPLLKKGCDALSKILRFSCLNLRLPLKFKLSAVIICRTRLQQLLDPSDRGGWGLGEFFGHCLRPRTQLIVRDYRINHPHFKSTAGAYDVTCDHQFGGALPTHQPWQDESSSTIWNQTNLDKSLIESRAFAGYHQIRARIVLIMRFRDVTNNLKLMRREVVRDLSLHEPGFAINAETGLQPLLMGYRLKEVPISWIGRGVDMGVSSFRVMKVGGGYWRVLYRLWLWRFLKIGPYRDLARRRGAAEQQWNAGIDDGAGSSVPRSIFK